MPKSWDVVVVGGGVVGCAIAYELAKEKVQVLLLERDHLCSGASYASAGMIAPLSDSPVDHPLSQLGFRSFKMYDSFVQGVEEASGFSVECLPSGIVRVALTEEDEQELRAEVAAAPTLGLTVDWLDTQQAREIEPLLSPEIRGATFSPGESQLNPSRYVEALRRAAVAQGVTVREHTPVVGLGRNGSRVSAVRTAMDTVAAGVVVLAMGAWSRNTAEWLGIDVPVRPVRGQVVYVNKLATPLRHTVMRGSSYAVPKGDGMTLVGTTREMAGFDQRTTAGGVASILTRIQDLVPAIAEASINHTRAGLRPVSEDEFLLLGPVPTMEGVMLATGHGRSGILLTPVTARLIADLIVRGADAAELGPHSASRLERRAA